MQTRDSLQLGMFIMPVHDPAKPLAQCYDEDLELIIRCEQAGFREAWVGEHHSSQLENIVMPEIFIARALGVTRSIRLGPAPVCLQYHHPMDVASRLAFLDHLSHGRLNVCFGPGAVPTDLEMHGVDPKFSSAMVAESIDFILKLWSSEPPYSMSGQFWNFSLSKYVTPELGIGRIHRPLQRPHPPIAVPAISRNSGSLKMAAARRFLPFSHHMASIGTLADHWQIYAGSILERDGVPNPADWRIARNVFVAETTAEARQIARANSLGRCLQYILDLTHRWGNIAMWKRDPAMSDADCNLDYFMSEVVIAGDPPEVTRRIMELREQVGPFGSLILVAHDWDDKPRWIRSFELFTREVVPVLNRQLGFSNTHGSS